MITRLIINFVATYHLKGQKFWIFVIHEMEARIVNYMNIYMKICAFKLYSSATYIYTVCDDN